MTKSGLIPHGLRFVLRRLERHYNCDIIRYSFTTHCCAVNINGSANAQLKFESGRLAKFADGSAVVSLGNNAILATAVSNADSSPSPNSFLPLTVDFKQSASAVGRIPMNYLRRELQQTDSDILTSRLIDRSIRPLFPKQFNNETQIICKPLCLDENGDSVVLGVNAASTALALSNIPWNGPVGAVRVALLDGNIVINPSRDALKKAKLNMVLSGCANGERILMIDMDACEVDARLLNECIDSGLNAITRIINAINEIASKAGRPKLELIEPECDDELMEEITKLSSERLYYILTDASHDKTSRDKAIAELRDEIVNAFAHEESSFVKHLFSKFTKKTLRDIVMETNVRCDGRGLEDFRPINIEVNLFDKLHGSALFQRGQTQVMGTVTFDSPSAAFHPDSISQLLGAQRRKMFMLNYEFPPYAVNEISTSKRLNRRELGHGALAEKALSHLIPHNFPYSIRLACQVLESNGSSSMASVCVGSLALMDAGVPLRSPAAGVAIGLITNDEDCSDYRILTDILGIEDYAGDMDLKIAGTSNGLTAMQLDLKIAGLNRKILTEAIDRGQEGIAHVLSIMNEAQKGPRSEFKDCVPVIENISIPIFRRHILFRSGAYNAKLIEAETGVKINIEDDANISLTAPNKSKLGEAKDMMERMFADESDIELNFGAIYKAEIVEILENGVMVTLKKGMRPMFLKNSNLDARRVAHASALGLEVGSLITVQYLGRDSATGHHRISRKTLQSATLPLQNLTRK